MGYDMSLDTPDETAAAAFSDARAAAMAACKVRDALSDDAPKEDHDAAQAEVMRLFNISDAVNTNYFRLNMWGMARMREGMQKLGLLATDYADHPAWPEIAAYGLEDWPDDEDESKLTADEKAFIAAQRAVTAWSPPDEPGIPVHKFGSNDGWHVTTRDCEAFARLLERADPADVAEVRADWANDDGSNYFDDWVAFVARGAAGTGFLVY